MSALELQPVEEIAASEHGGDKSAAIRALIAEALATRESPNRSADGEAGWYLLATIRTLASEALATREAAAKRPVSSPAG